MLIVDMHMDLGPETEDYPDRAEFEEVDSNVVASLPEGAVVEGARCSGASYWTKTARIDVKLGCGLQKSFFLKVAEGENGKSMMHGEYESMKAIIIFGPDFVPHPIAWGTFSADPTMHFMVSEFREMNPQVPDMRPTCAKLAELHLRSHSAGVQQFGFPVTTHNGSLSQDNKWRSTWEEFYAQHLKGMLVLEEEAHGPRTEEIQELFLQIFDKVIPRLLRPMETNGHKVLPTLIHGDFWHGNVATDINTGKPITYDASAFWGHNEYDIRTMTKESRYKFGPAWQREYLKHYPAAYPPEDFEARSELYIFASMVHDAALFSDNPKFRETMIEHARVLVDAFGEGYEAWLHRLVK